MHPFVPIAATPQARRLAAAGLIGRFREAGVGLAIVLSARDSGYSYAVAGLAAAVYLVACAISRPAHGRRVDRVGAPRALLVPSVANSLALAALAAAAWQRAGELVFLGCAALIGVTLPALSATLRALWPRVTASALDATYAFDTLIYEVSLIASPALVGVIAVQVSVPLALIVLAATGTIGTAAVSLSPAARWAKTGPPATHPGRPLLGPVVIFLVAIEFLIGGAEGSMTVLVPGFASSHRVASASGILVSALSAGSLAGALAYGLIARRTTWPTRLIACTGALTVTLTALPTLARSPVAFALLLAVVGVTLAPTLTTGFIAIKDAAPPQALAEAFTWASFSAAAGSAAAQALAGQLINGPGITTALWEPAGATMLALLATTLTVRLVAKPRPQPTAHSRVVMSRPPRSKSGISITDEPAEELADEAEAGYELTEAKRVGRKSLAGSRGTSPRVNFRMTTELQARAQARAKREGKTVSEIAREALEQYVK